MKENSFFLFIKAKIGELKLQTVRKNFLVTACLCDVNSYDEHGLPVETSYFLCEERAFPGLTFPPLEEPTLWNVKASLGNQKFSQAASSV